MGKIKVKQVKSVIGRTQKQKDTIFALGLRRINSTAEHTTSPQILGMIKKVAHLIEVEQI